MAEREPSRMSSHELLEEALKAREKFLREQPHLQPFQDEIDRILDKTVGFENRMAVLAFMIEKKLYELKEAFADLRMATLKAQGLLGKTKIDRADKILDYSTNPDGHLN